MRQRSSAKKSVQRPSEAPDSTRTAGPLRRAQHDPLDASALRLRTHAGGRAVDALGLDAPHPTRSTILYCLRRVRESVSYLGFEPRPLLRSPAAFVASFFLFFYHRSVEPVMVFFFFHKRFGSVPKFGTTSTPPARLPPAEPHSRGRGSRPYRLYTHSTRVPRPGPTARQLPQMVNIANTWALAACGIPTTVTLSGRHTAARPSNARGVRPCPHAILARAPRARVTGYTASLKRCALG